MLTGHDHQLKGKLIHFEMHSYTCANLSLEFSELKQTTAHHLIATWSYYTYVVLQKEQQRKCMFEQLNSNRSTSRKSIITVFMVEQWRLPNSFVLIPLGVKPALWKHQYCCTACNNQILIFPPTQIVNRGEWLCFVPLWLSNGATVKQPAACDCMNVKSQVLSCYSVHIHTRVHTRRVCILWAYSTCILRTVWSHWEWLLVQW